MEAMKAAKAARVDMATLAALLDGDGDGEAGAGPAGVTTAASDGGKGRRGALCITRFALNKVLSNGS